jgi:hypothetical protein
MISQLQYINYFTGLAMRHKAIQHQPGKKEAFFFIPMPWDLDGIDKAMRNTKSVPLLALDGLRGMIDDGMSESYVQHVEGQFTILDKPAAENTDAISQAQDKCLPIGLQLLAKMKADARRKQLIDPAVRFSVSKVPYEPVGPMALNHYGYTFQFTLTISIGMPVSDEVWLDDDLFFPYDLNPTT